MFDGLVVYRCGLIRGAGCRRCDGPSPATQTTAPRANGNNAPLRAAPMFASRTLYCPIPDFCPSFSFTGLFPVFMGNATLCTLHSHDISDFEKILST